MNLIFDPKVNVWGQYNINKGDIVFEKENLPMTLNKGCIILVFLLIN